MSSMKDFLKQRKQRQPGVQSETTPNQADQLVPPQEPEATIRYKCGHTKPLRCFEEANCSICRQNKKKRSRDRYTPRIVDQKGRLPDGSIYQKKYDATAQLWTVTLIVPMDGETKHFSATGSGSMRTEFECDNLYRAWLDARDV